MNLALLGSPSMPVWTATPQEFTDISHPLSIPEGGNQNFTVDTGLEGSLVCIYQENDGYYNYGLTNAQGTITFNIELTATDRLWVTATHKNYIPYQYSMIPGVPGPPQNVSLTSYGPPDHHPLIAWDQNPETDIDGYNIYRNLTTGGQSTGFILQNPSLIPGTSWVDEDFNMSHQGDTRADYYVTAVDVDQNESEPSEDVSTLGYDPDSGELINPVLSLYKEHNGLLIYPNPFNQKVTIKFAYPETETATIALYDITGRKVAEIFHGVLSPNTICTFSYDAEALSSGIYICQVNTGGKRVNKKMLLLK